MHLITVANRTAGHINLLYENGFKNVAHTTHYDEKFKTKVESVNLFCKSVDANDIVVYADGFDCAVARNLSIMEYLLDGYQGVLFGAEKNCYPNAGHKDKYPITTVFRYLNAGLFVGSAGKIAEVTDEALKRFKSGKIDQEIFSEMFLEGSWGIELDNYCEFFQNMYLVKPHEFDKKQNKNLITNTYPYIVHGNGQSDISWLTQ